MITVKNISKSFGRTQVLGNVSFEIGKGEIVGFLGPNGAGKTTLMRILTSYFPPDNGFVAIAGYNLKMDSFFARQKIGYLPETPPLYQDMRVVDYLKFSAKLKGIETRDLNRQIEKALETCKLNDAAHKIISVLSKGYKQRVGIAQAIIHDPEVLILDEPTSGLDPLQILQVRQLIQNLEHKRTVILSTHILSEIEQIAKRVIILNKGEIVADQNLDELFTAHGPGARLEDIFLKLTSPPS